MMANKLKVAGHRLTKLFRFDCILIAYLQSKPPAKLEACFLGSSAQFKFSYISDFCFFEAGIRRSSKGISNIILKPLT